MNQENANGSSFEPEQPLGNADVSDASGVPDMSGASEALDVNGGAGGPPAEVEAEGVKAGGLVPAQPISTKVAEDPLEDLRVQLSSTKSGTQLQIPVLLERDMDWLLDQDPVREIHDHLPSGELRNAFSRIGYMEALPLIDPRTKLDHSIIVALSDVLPNGQKLTLDSLVIPITDFLKPRLAQIGLGLKHIRFLLLPRKRYRELTGFAEDTDEASKLRRRKLAELDPEATARKALPEILMKAVLLGVSDIHIEPRLRGYSVRMRIAGKLQRVYTLPPKTGAALGNVLKVEAQLSLDEYRLPQDGRISIDRMRGLEEEVLDVVRGYSLRVSTVPTVARERGEKIVLRLLRAASPDDFALDKLNLPGAMVKELLEILRSPNGMVLVTGPTGSGKTTTLYSMLRHLNTGDCNIMTAEDPVEVRFPDMDQCQVHAKIELSFARLLRSFLRQDPDIILLGEVRDEETARIAVQAAQTGHLLLATVHTNDAFGVLHRLMSFGITGSEMENSLRAVIAQRLIRVLCPHCNEQYDASDEVNQLLDISTFSPGAVTLWRPKPKSGDFCRVCNNTGFSGRAPIVELWVPSDEERREIVYNVDLTHDMLAEIAVKRGMKRMSQLALEYVAIGQTTIGEVLDKVASVSELRRDPLKPWTEKLFSDLALQQAKRGQEEKSD